MKKGKFGPGFLVTAAFVGPGTVTSATLAGSKFGYSLLWVIVAAVVSAIIVQEMVGRFSLGTRSDISAAMVGFSKLPVVKWLLSALIFIAIIFGCTAYEAGNIIGGSMGLNVITGLDNLVWIVLITLLALGLLLKEDYKFIEKFLVTLVVIMGSSFLITALLAAPKLSAVFSGLIPKIPDSSLTYVLALLGTTVVPYNLFLHSSVVLKKWGSPSEIPAMRKDLYLSIGLGGIITMSIVVTAAAAFFLSQNEVKTPADLALQLKPLFGDISHIFLGIGLFAAGLSSAITAPYAAAWTAKGLFGWEKGDKRFKWVFICVLLIGAFVSSLAIKQPLELILLAQIANALILPVVLFFLFYLLNQKAVGSFRNTLIHNVLFVMVFLLIIFLNIKKFF